MVALVKQQTADGSDLLSQYRVTGAPEIFAQIMRAYGGMVFSVCFKVTKVAADAEDASQATFLTLAVQCKTGAVITYLGPWLKKVAKRTALDLIRSRKRRTRRETITAEGRPEFYAARACGESENAEISQIIRHELDQLPAKYRMPLVLHYFGGLSHDQISQEMRCTTAALGVRLHRARKMLGKRLTVRGVNLERGALGAAIAVAIHQVITDRFVHSTQQATLAMAWAHPGSCIGTLPHHLGDITALVAQVAASMGRAKTRMAAVAMAASITMLGGAAEAMRHLPDSIRPNLEFLAPSKAIESFFERMNVPSLHVQDDTDTPEATGAYASKTSRESGSAVTDPDQKSYGTAPLAGIPLAPPTPASTPAHRQQVLTSIIPTPHSPPPITPPGELSPSPYRTQQQSEGTRTVIVRDHSTSPAPERISFNSSTQGTSTTRGTGGSSGGGSSGSDAIEKPVRPSAPPPMFIPAATSEPKLRHLERFTPTDAAAASSFNLAPVGVAVGQFAASATDASVLSTFTGPIVPDFSTAGMHSGGIGDSFTLGSGDRLVHAGNGTYQWNDATNGIAFGGVNSATVTFEDVVGGGVLSIERLSTQTTLAPARPLGHHFIGIWSFDTTFAYDAVSLNVRYDEALAQSLGLPENILKLWVYDGELDHWARIMDGTFSRDLGEHTLHGAYTRGSIEYFAVSAPEPVGVFSFLVAGTAALLRRRRNYW